MRPIERDLLTRWQAALGDLVDLSVGDGTPASIRALDDAAAARQARTLPMRGPLAAFSRFAVASIELEQFLDTQDNADPAVARARSAGAHADFEAAGFALDLAVAADEQQHRHLVAMRHDRLRLDAAEIDVLEGVLRGSHDIRGGAVETIDWAPRLHRDLATVTDDAAAKLVALGASTFGDQVADGFGPSLGTLLDDDVLGKLIDASSHAIGYLHRVALALAHGGLRKIAGVCDEGIRKSVGEWFTRDPDDPAGDIVEMVAGVDLAAEAWFHWSEAGVDVSAQLVAVARSRDEHLQHLAWAARAAGVAAFAYAASLASPPTVPFAVFFGGVALVGAAAWMLWAAHDHCAEVADLV